MIDWERAYRHLQREYDVLPRTGANHGHRLLKLWHKVDDLPEWLPDPVLDLVENTIARLCCLVHNHTPFTEMDRRSIVCAVCHRFLGEHVISRYDPSNYP